MANAKQLAMITKVLDAYSAQQKLTPELRESAGAFLLVEFNTGARTQDALTERLLHYLGPR